MTTAATTNPLRLHLVVPPAVRSGTAVPITLRAENTGDRPIELYLRGRTIAFDVVVRRPGGADVWRRLDGKVIPAILQLRVLEPGEALELHTTWNQRSRAGTAAGPGEYLVHAFLLGEGPEPLTTPPATLRIERPGA